jgi:thymidylate synthase (FAD)
LKIELLDITSIKVLELAAAEPCQSEPSEKLVQRVWKSRHRSIARHGMAAFLVKDVSQNLLRQLSRHPHINLTVKSSRYNDMGDAAVVYPPFLAPQDMEEYFDGYRQIMELYCYWDEKEGYPKKARRELAKLFLPLGGTTDLVMSGNFQALYEFLQLRLFSRAEWEIYKMASAMAQLLKEAMPTIFNGLGCRGDEYGFCPEGHGSCGKYRKKTA